MARLKAPCSSRAAQEKNAAVDRSGRAACARVKKSGYFANCAPVNPLSTTPCLSGHTALAIDDHPGPESVRALITRSPGDTDSPGGSGTTSPGDSVRGAAFSPYGSRLVPYEPADISDVRPGGRSARSRSKRRPSMPTTSTLLLSWDIPPSKRHG